jgi:hypothetical protein
VHGPILAAPESIGPAKFRGRVAGTAIHCGKTRCPTVRKMRKTGPIHLERGGSGVPKRQNNNFLDCALHFVIC